MKKAFVLALAAVTLISGCAGGAASVDSDITESSIEGNSNAENSAAQPAEQMVIKWGVEDFSDDEGRECLADLNEQLAAEGSNIRVEFIKMDKDFDQDMTFAQLILDGEKENGAFDIVTYGADWVHKRGAATDFLASGYFRELGEDYIAAFSDIPEICWKAAKVHGKNYTVPALNFGISGVGLYVHFNTKYIPEDIANSFDGDIAKLPEILEGIDFGEGVRHLEYQKDYLDFTLYTPASDKGELYLSDKTMTAFDPYECEEVIEYARTLNRLYNAGHMNYRIDFSKLGDKEMTVTKFAILVAGGKLDKEELTEHLGKDYQVVIYEQPYYMENRVLNSTGIPTNSPHPEEAMELLKRLHNDKEFSGLLTGKERDAIGLPRDNNAVIDFGDTKLSPFADFEINYKDMDEFKDVSTLCRDSFDKLCKAENFDETLAEIVSELKAAGIDDYVARINQRLEENRDASNQ